MHGGCGETGLAIRVPDRCMGVGVMKTRFIIVIRQCTRQVFGGCSAEQFLEIN